MREHVYHEKFEEGAGGWYGWVSNAGGPKALERQQGQVTSRSPWWIDYNPAPPGAGYIHMVFCLATVGPQGEVFMEVDCKVGHVGAIALPGDEMLAVYGDYRQGAVLIRWSPEGDVH